MRCYFGDITIDLGSNVPIVSTYSLVIQDLDRERRLRTGEYDGEPRLPPRLGERLLLRRLLLLLPPLRPPRSRSLRRHAAIPHRFAGWAREAGGRVGLRPTRWNA